MKEALNVIAKLRKLGPLSYGITIPKEVIDSLNLEDGMFVYLDIRAEEKLIHYECGVCKTKFGEAHDEVEPICPCCSEMHYLKKIEELQ